MKSGRCIIAGTGLFAGLAEGMMEAQARKRQQALDVAAQVWKQREFQQEEERIQNAKKVAEDHSFYQQIHEADQYNLGLTKSEIARQATEIKGLQESLNAAKLPHQIDALDALTGERKAKTADLAEQTRIRESREAVDMLFRKAQVKSLEAKVPLIEQQVQTSKSMQRQYDANTARAVATTAKVKQDARLASQKYDFNEKNNPLLLEKTQKGIDELDAKIRMMPVIENQHLLAGQALQQLMDFRKTFNNASGRPLPDDLSRIITQGRGIESASNVANKALETQVKDHKALYDQIQSREQWLREHRNPTEIGADGKPFHPMYPAGAGKFISKGELSQWLTTAYQHLSHIEYNVKVYQKNVDMMNGINQAYQNELISHGLKQKPNGEKLNNTPPPSGNLTLPGANGVPTRSINTRPDSGRVQLPPTVYDGGAAGQYSIQAVNNMSSERKKALMQKMTAAGKRADFIAWLQKHGYK